MCPQGRLVRNGASPRLRSSGRLQPSDGHGPEAAAETDEANAASKSGAEAPPQRIVDATERRACPRTAALDTEVIVLPALRRVLARQRDVVDRFLGAGGRPSHHAAHIARPRRLASLNLHAASTGTPLPMHSWLRDSGQPDTNDCRTRDRAMYLPRSRAISRSNRKVR